RAAVGDVDLHVAAAGGVELAERHAVARIAGGGDHGLERGEVDVEGGDVGGARVGLHDARAHRVGVEAALLHEVVDDDLVRLDDPGEAARLDRHVGERGAL